MVKKFIISSPNISNEQVQEYLGRLNEFYETKMYQLYEKVDEDTNNIIGEFTPKKDEKIIRILPILINNYKNIAEEILFQSANISCETYSCAIPTSFSLL